MIDIENIETLYTLIYEICNYLDEECIQICKTIWDNHGDHFSDIYIAKIVYWVKT